MITAEFITRLANTHLEGSSLFVTLVDVGAANVIKVSIDGDNGVDIADCVALSRHIEQSLDREKEDFALEVSSHGADAPLIFPRQFIRHIGKSIQIKAFDATITKGKLTQADQNSITVEVPAKKKVDIENINFTYTDIKEARIILSFKNL